MFNLLRDQRLIINQTNRGEVGHQLPLLQTQQPLYVVAVCVEFSEFVHGEDGDVRVDVVVAQIEGGELGQLAEGEGVDVYQQVVAEFERYQLVRAEHRQRGYTVVV